MRHTHCEGPSYDQGIFLFVPLSCALETGYSGKPCDEEISYCNRLLACAFKRKAPGLWKPSASVNMAEDNPELQAALRQLDKDLEVCEWHCNKTQKQEKEYYAVPHPGARCLANLCASLIGW